ncbi:unnamed protein product [Microthlaspi erraticum]|uniref:Uncharacterized protein n=1 Tax=Microthlaspi erraticum TaxID=1685480 RepID=A0A6D2JSC1_9BRAS|nr:unnamed protein product [Microthlaspi erraticum]
MVYTRVGVWIPQCAPKNWEARSWSGDGRRPSGALHSTGSFGAFWSIWDTRSMEGLGTWSSSTGYAKEEGGSHLEDQLDHLLDQPVEFLNSTGQASTRSS